MKGTREEGGIRAEVEYKDNISNANTEYLIKKREKKEK